MHVITSIVPHLAPSSLQGATGSSPSQSNSNFQIAMQARMPTQSPTQGVSSSVSPTLESQTASSLLQTQDLAQAQSHGGGGGGHHGGMKMTPGLEAEETGEGEETLSLRQRKKLPKTILPDNASESAEINENGVAMTSTCETNEAQRSKNGSGHAKI